MRARVLAGDLLKYRSLSLAWHNLRGQWRARRGDHSLDPHRQGLDQPILGGRQHFLRWETPTTARLWDDNDLDYDTTLSYADHPGFRCGTCFECPMFDATTQQPLRLRQRPLVLMECSVIAERYLGLGYSDDALALMLKYRETCQRVSGDFTLLWHNSHLGSASDRRFYQTLVG